MITQIDNLYENDPEAYWKLIKDLKEESNVSDPSQSIAADDWLQHLLNLYNIKQSFINKNEQFEKDLDSITHLKTFSDLNILITSKEVTALLYKSAKLDINGPFRTIIQHMYQDNILYVRIQDKLTCAFKSKIGVLQGDNIRPNFFKIFLNDLLDMFDKGDDQVQLDNNFISPLLYADDLMLLSTSKARLQRYIDKLASYSEDNCLTVNLKKTKIVVFFKSGKLSKEIFCFTGTGIQNSSSYNYLGILLSSSGTFSYCQSYLYKRALRAQFKLTKCFSNMTPKLDTLIHLFEHTVEPVVLYGSEIWGTVNILSSKIRKADFSLEHLFENFLCDKLQIKFLKYISKINKKSANLAVLSEFGRYPLCIKVITNTCNFLQRLLTTRVSQK